MSVAWAMITFRTVRIGLSKVVSSIGIYYAAVYEYTDIQNIFLTLQINVDLHSYEEN